MMILLLGNIACNFKKIPMLTQDLSRRCIATRGGVCPRTLVDQKRKRYVNMVDVVECLHDPTDPSTQCMAPPSSAHVQLDDVPQTLDLAEGRGRVSSARRRGDGDVIRAGLCLSTTAL